MALYIDPDECITCADCEPVCPTDAISEGALVFEINKHKCTECEGVYDQPECQLACPIDNCIIPLEA